MQSILLKLFTAIGICCILIGLILSVKNTLPEKKSDMLAQDAQNKNSISQDEYYAIAFQQLQTMNEDFIGKLKVGNLIEECVVKSTDNDDYLWKNLEREPYGEGTVFLDFRNELDDQNLILYGMTVFSDLSLRFGSLSELEDQSVYESNKLIYFETDSGKKCYEICAVLHFSMNENTTDYAKPSFSTEEFSIYTDYVMKHNLIDSSLRLNESDQMLTLCTDLKDYPDAKLVVVAKEVNE